MDALQILSLGRNLIRKIEGLDPVAETLEQLWLSYNQLERLVRAACAATVTNFSGCQSPPASQRATVRQCCSRLLPVIQHMCRCSSDRCLHKCRQRYLQIRCAVRG